MHVVYSLAIPTTVPTATPTANPSPVYNLTGDDNTAEVVFPSSFRFGNNYYTSVFVSIIVLICCNDSVLYSTG